LPARRSVHSFCALSLVEVLGSAQSTLSWSAKFQRHLSAIGSGMLTGPAGSSGRKLRAHPHMLRCACGYALANKGHDTRAIQAWLGHRSITSTAIYTALAPNRFKEFWRE